MTTLIVIGKVSKHCLPVCLPVYLFVNLCICLYNVSPILLPVVTISPESVNVMYGSTVTLTCEVQSLTTPNVNWTSNTNVDLTSTSLVSNNYIHTSTLTLEQVTLEYIGEYTCTAVNEGGEMSDMIDVNVYGKNMSVSTHLCLTYSCTFVSVLLS